LVVVAPVARAHTIPGGFDYAGTGLHYAAYRNELGVAGAKGRCEDERWQSGWGAQRHAGVDE
jgi:hypothetical protein